MAISAVTQTAREKVALLTSEIPMYAVLHHSEPITSDPLSTQVAISGQIGMPVLWVVESTVLSNSLPITWTGIVGEGEVPAWVALCADIAGKEILFYGEPSDTSTSSAEWDSFVVEAGTLVLTF
jgi:hypothetical protein